MSGHGGVVEVSVFSNDRNHLSRLSRGSVDQGCDDGGDHGGRSAVGSRS